ncbi:MAG: hypothetical protein ABJD07_05185 [Gemmatimonadaceae bacterium]
MTTFVIFFFLAVYNAGCMTALQLQHYAIYPLVGRESFANYMRANNRAAAVPTIVPAMLLLISTIVLAIDRPAFIHATEMAIAVALNFLALASTILWQRRLQAEMAVSGYDEQKVRRLIGTNWIRTVAHLLLALLATGIVARVVSSAAMGPVHSL